jgi:hypothetical protein
VFIFDLDYRLFLSAMPDFFLPRLKVDLPPFIAMYEASVSKAVGQILAAAGEVVRVERSAAVACKADSNARNALDFSLYCCAQWRRLVMFKLGTR